MPISTFCPDGKYHPIHQPRCPICTIETLTAELKNRKKQFDAYYDAEEINNAGLEQEICYLKAVWAGYNPKQVKKLVEERIEQGKMIAAMSASVAELRTIEANARYEVSIMSAITGRRDNETLTDAVTRVVRHLSAFHDACAHVADLYGEDSERGLVVAEILRYQKNLLVRFGIS